MLETWCEHGCEPTRAHHDAVATDRPLYLHHLVFGVFLHATMSRTLAGRLLWFGASAIATASTPPPVAWTIAGSDAGGGAGIQADLKTFHCLGVHGCSAITALTAQNSREVRAVEYPSLEFLRTTLEALRDDLLPSAIKLGMLGSRDIIGEVSAFLTQLAAGDAAIVCDPVMVTTSGARLLDEDAVALLQSDLFPQCDLVTPNLPELEALLGGREIRTAEAVQAAAAELIAHGGCRAVLIKGGHSMEQSMDGKEAAVAQDYWTDGTHSAWLSTPRLDTTHTHGTGCTLSSAIAALLARGFPILDAIVLAKAYVTQGIAEAVQIGGGPGPVAHTRFPAAAGVMPWLTQTAAEGASPPLFARCAPMEMCCVLPVVDTVDLVRDVVANGASHVQLRLKGAKDDEVADQVASAQAACVAHGAKLWVNDHWRAALEAGAYGVHVGQEDLAAMSTDDIRTLASAGLRLGISTHSYAELATALGVRPSYISLGPVFATTSKDVSKWGQQGVARVAHWRQLLPEDTPLVAIGGISLDRAPEVLEAGADGIAVIGAITKAEDRAATLQAWRALWS